MTEEVIRQQYDQMAQGRLPSLLFHADRNLNLSFAGWTFPRKFHHPIPSHLRFELHSINSRCTGFGHVASGIHDHAGHIHHETGLNLTHILGLTIRIGKPN